MRRHSVFINCPFTPDYQEFFRAAVYVVIRSGFRPRCALEEDDGGQNRLEKICAIVAQCQLGIHDISKTELDRKSRLPRFNMPLELGLFLGARKFGSGVQKRKRCIIFDRSKYRYQSFISDIAGQDIHSHDGKLLNLIMELSAWLRIETKEKKIPGGKIIAAESKKFQSALPKICKAKKLAISEMTYSDYLNIAVEWISVAS